MIQWDQGEQGHPQIPYIVCNAVLLNKIRENTATTLTFYKLGQDIDLEGAAFEPLGAAEVGCLQTGAFAYYFDGDGKRIINYKLPMSRQDYYHPTDRLQDIFGRCVTNVVSLTVNPGSSSGQTEFCDLFDFGSSGDVGLTEAVEQSDGSFIQGPRILCSVDQLNTIDGDTNNLTKDYILYKDMDFEDVEYAEAIIDGDYTGTFDGNNKTIRNLNINSSSLHVGFFKRIQQGGSVKNLRFENVSIKSTNSTGVSEHTSIRTYNPSRLGVLAGEVREGQILNCSVTDSDADVDIFYENSSSSAVVVGGLIGYGLGLDLEDSSSENLHIKVVNSNSSYLQLFVGGLVGHQGVCAHQSISSVDCSIGSDSDILGRIKRSYSAYQNIDIEASFKSSVGGLIGLAGFDENNTFEITDSYAWENNLTSSGSNEVVDFGGLVGELDGTFFGSGSNSLYQIYTGNLKILNSYALGGNISIEKGFVGGLFGSQVQKGARDSSVTLKNSFSAVPFTNFYETTWSTYQTQSVHDSSVGGLYGSGGTGGQVFRDFSESYYTGQISCIPFSRRDRCGGIVGSLGVSDANNFTGKNLYSAAEIQQASENNRRDNIGLLFSEQTEIFQSSTSSTNPVFIFLSAFGPATDGVDNPPLYFRRNGITTIKGTLPGATGGGANKDVSLKSSSQPCYVLTGTVNEGCLGLAVDPENAITAGNRSLTPAQFRTVPSDPTTATGTSPALGNEFLYTTGWCPRVCRDGSSSCTETSNTLVGFDENGNSLKGPGGGLEAQSRNEGRNCFEPCFEFEGNNSGVISNTIKAYRCKMTEVQIPENTTSILADAFKNHEITSVTFPDSLISIGNNAFSGTDIVNVIIPSGITSIGDNAFSNNSSLTSVCIEAQEAQVALGTTPFGSLASSAITYESDGDCSN